MAKCKETAGVLYPHPCTRESTLSCSKCSKPICSLHSREIGGGSLCIACFKQDPGRDPGLSATDPFLMAAVLYPDYDTGGSLRRLRQATSSDAGLEVGDEAFETDFDGT